MKLPIFHRANHSPQMVSKTDRETTRVILIACIIIILSTAFIAGIGYWITENEVVHKLKTQDLFTISDAILSQINAPIERAMETSLLLSEDPFVQEWVEGEETDLSLQQYALQRIGTLAGGYDYSNAFIVSNTTKQYWTEDGQMIDVLSEEDPDDDWFFHTIQSGLPVSVSVDYNNERKDTFVFINALMGPVSHPLAVVGTGFSLDDFAAELQSFQYGQEANIWFVDEEDMIVLSNHLEHNGRSIEAYLPLSNLSENQAGISENQADRPLSSVGTDASVTPEIMEYQDEDGERFDIIQAPVEHTDLMMVYRMPRSETTAFLKTIRQNLLWAVLIILVLMIFIFYFVSRKIVNPYQRSLALNQELEALVDERTRELAEKNQRWLDSVHYAKQIQESVLPDETQLAGLFSDSFLLWKPRDIVGGDFYWVKRFEQGFLVAVGDCSGHGVPGALMSMTSISILNQVAVEDNKANPGRVLQELNILLRRTLNQENPDGLTDDGLDIGLCFVDDRQLIFSGTKNHLYWMDQAGLHIAQGDTRGIGYRKTPASQVFENHEVPLSAQQQFFLTTDGYTDQNGGEHNLPFGKKALHQLIREAYDRPRHDQKALFDDRLKQYMGDEAQRDDILVLGFSLK